MPRGKPPRDRVGDANGAPNRARWRAGSERRLASREGEKPTFFLHAAKTEPTGRPPVR